MLFVSPSPVTARALAKALDVEVRDVREAVASLAQESGGHGVEPVEVAGGYQLRTKPEHSELLRQFLQAKPSRLSRAALEALSIVAYRQPITRAEVEDVRGVDSGAVLKGLLERRLLRIIGRKEEPGRPILYGTTSTFLELFSIKNLKELPTLREFVELSEDHQRLVDREPPTVAEATRQEVEDYLSELESSPYDDFLDEEGDENFDDGDEVGDVDPDEAG